MADDHDKLHECPVLIADSDRPGAEMKPGFAVRGSDEPCIKSRHFESHEVERWTGHDGIQRIRQVRAGSSVGASASYSAGYDAMDWGN